MGIPKLILLLLNKTIKNPQLKSPIKLTLIRKLSQCSTGLNNSLYTKTVQFVANSPKNSLIPLLVEYQDNNEVKNSELKKIIHALRRKKNFDRALEVSEWMISRPLAKPIPGDLAVQLDLTCQVRGIDAAERFFKQVNDDSERLYGALLSCYVKATLVDKSFSLFKLMKKKGLVTAALAYNNIMTLCIKIGEIEKVPRLLIEMDEDGITPDSISFKICLKSLTFKSDTTSIEMVLKIMDKEARPSMDWSTCSLVANYFIDEGCVEKAMAYLKKSEDRVHDNPVGLKHLLTMYAKLGDTTEVMRLWEKHKSLCKAQINVDYMTMIGTLVKMDKLREAERIFREWESSRNLYDFRVPNVLLLGYTRKGLIEKAEQILEEIISNGNTPIAKTWIIISGGYVKCRNMDKAVQSMKKALELGAEHQGWVPKREILSSILEWLGDDGEIGEVDRFLELLNRVVPMNQEMYRALLRATIRHGNDVGDILQKMKVANIEVDEETSTFVK